MLEIQIQSEATYDLLEINGEIDASSSIELDNAIQAAEQTASPKLIADLSRLSYISSAGLGVFISHLDDLRAKNKQLVLFGLDEKVYEVFKILGLEQIITIVSTKEEALSFSKK